MGSLHDCSLCRVTDTVRDGAYIWNPNMTKNRKEGRGQTDMVLKIVEFPPQCHDYPQLRRIFFGADSSQLSFCWPRYDPAFLGTAKKHTINIYQDVLLNNPPVIAVILPGKQALEKALLALEAVTGMVVCRRVAPPKITDENLPSEKLMCIHVFICILHEMGGIPMNNAWLSSDT